jgi:hypothetical protein
MTKATDTHITNPLAVASTVSIASLGQQVAAMWERHHKADLRRTKARQDSAACAKADAACRGLLDEIERLTAAMFSAPIVTQADVVALAVAGFESADVMAAGESSADQRRVYDLSVRAAFARIARWEAEAAAMPLGQLTDQGTVALMLAA